jgi:hypothetical protein
MAACRLGTHRPQPADECRCPQPEIETEEEFVPADRCTIPGVDDPVCLTRVRSQVDPRLDDLQ